MNPRETALKLLYKIEYEGAYSNMAIKSGLSGDFSKIDKAFITQLVYGVVRYKLTLDYIISKFSSVKIKKLSKFTLLILRLGVYQIKYMDKVPVSAAVNESVKLAKRFSSKSSGFVNAVLHSVIKGIDSIEYPSDKIDNLSVKYSFPSEIVKMFIDFPFCEELLSSLNDEPEMSVRVNTLINNNPILNDEKFKASSLYKYAKNLNGVDIAGSLEYNAGYFTVQDVAAMMASLALSPMPGQVVIDACAAPGGKTTHLAELMKNTGVIHAFDVHEHKIDIINKNAQRMGISIINAECHNSTEVKEDLINKADKILVDVPCSGLGIIRRKADIKWNKDDIKSLPDLQYKILQNASLYLKSGGELVYSTCTLNPDENEGVILKFLKENPQFIAEKITLPSPLDRENDGYITFYPNIDNTDGFFISKIKRCI